MLYIILGIAIILIFHLLSSKEQDHKFNRRNGD